MRLGWRPLQKISITEQLLNNFAPNQASVFNACEASQHAEVQFHAQNLRYGTNELIDAGLLRIQLHGNVRNGFRFDLR
jgi:hypothetical protein